MEAELYTKEHFLEILEALHHDQTDLAQALVDVRKIITSWSWILEGRGSYEWDDPDYQKEFGWCLDQVLNEIDNALKKTSNAHQICCGKYRHILDTDKAAVQLRFPYGRTYQRHREDILKATTVVPVIAMEYDGQ